MLFSYALVILSYLKEKNKGIKLERLVNIIFIIPAYTTLMISDTILPIFKHTDNSYLYLCIIIYLIVCSCFLALKATFFGVRITFVKNKSTYENRMYNSSVSMLNHSIKNEVSIILKSLVQKIPNRQLK